MKRYQEGGTPRPDMRPKEEQQADIAEQSKKQAAEREAAAVQRAKDKEMDKKMREARKKAKKTPLFNKGGSIDGCAIRGKTRGTIV